jgi:hypothetical protein
LRRSLNRNCRLRDWESYLGGRLRCRASQALAKRRSPSFDDFARLIAVGLPSERAADTNQNRNAESCNGADHSSANG